MDTVQIDFLNIDQQWDKKIKHCHFDIYHLSGWVAASAIVDKGTPMGLMATYKNKQLFLPIIIRKIDSAYWDATTTYGYGGPLMDKSLSDAEADYMLQAVKERLFAKGCVSLFMRLHPIINKDWIPTVGKALTHGLTPDFLPFIPRRLIALYRLWVVLLSALLTKLMHVLTYLSSYARLNFRKISPILKQLYTNDQH